jgi:methylmalonyl-CoA mutase
VIRATPEEKERQIATIASLHARHAARAREALSKVQQAAIRNENVFERLMEAAKYCSLGQLTEALFNVGGEYRRSM